MRRQRPASQSSTTQRLRDTNACHQAQARRVTRCRGPPRSQTRTHRSPTSCRGRQATNRLLTTARAVVDDNGREGPPPEAWAVIIVSLPSSLGFHLIEVFFYTLILQILKDFTDKKPPQVLGTDFIFCKPCKHCKPCQLFNFYFPFTFLPQHLSFPQHHHS